VRKDKGRGRYVFRYLEYQACKSSYVFGSCVHAHMCERERERKRERVGASMLP
jgi:hypothetical protein